MNKNRRMKHVVAASLAFGAAALTEFGQIAPAAVYAAEQTETVKTESTKSGEQADEGLFKEETVYVNADANGAVKLITVSDWLKNAGTTESLKDVSELDGIKNIKGEETFSESGDNLTWDTNGADIYYQGTTEKELPVSVKLTYYLDGKKISPSELKGKSGHLKIKIDYTNNTKKSVNVSGKSEELSSPFVMMTGMILPNETFSNVAIDNGKVVSDGNRNIVLGFAVPGMKESLGMNDFSQSSSQVSLPESLEISADVTDFTMSSTYTVALSDILEDLNVKEIVDYSSLQSALDELENAALELVSGTDTLSSGAAQLSSGAAELEDGIKKYTDGTDTLANGVVSYVNGEQQLADGAKSLTELSAGLSQVQSAVSQLSAATDGSLTSVNEKDIKAGAQKLADGTQQLVQVLGTEAVQAVMQQVTSMIEMGKALIEETKGLETSLQNGIVTPVQDLAAQAQAISGELQKISDLQTNLTNACTAVNTAVNENNAVIDADNGQIAANNEKITSAKTKAISSSQTIQQAVDSLTAKRNEIAQNDPQSAALADLDNAIQALNEAKNAAAEVTDMPELSSIEGKLNPVQADLSGVDVQAVQNAVGKMKVDLFTLKLAAAGMNAKLPEVEEKLDAIQKAGENLPLDQLGALTGKIDDLNTGMQGLNSGIGSLHTNLSSLDQSLAVSVPKAASGIAQLNGGFTQLGSFNSQLTAGAEQLKENSSVLKNGVSALNSGAKTLSEGAVTLADGMKTFDAEGTSKLKTTVEGAVGELMNRLEALTSKECSYDTFSGKDSAMDGNVKFVIETEAIE